MSRRQHFHALSILGCHDLRSIQQKLLDLEVPNWYVDDIMFVSGRTYFRLKNYSPSGEVERMVSGDPDVCYEGKLPNSVS